MKLLRRSATIALMAESDPDIQRFREVTKDVIRLTREFQELQKIGASDILKTAKYGEMQKVQEEVERLGKILKKKRR